MRMITQYAYNEMMKPKSILMKDNEMEWLLPMTSFGRAGLFPANLFETGHVKSEDKLECNTLDAYFRSIATLIKYYIDSLIFRVC
jgi:hypothetical protein